MLLFVYAISETLPPRIGRYGGIPENGTASRLGVFGVELAGADATAQLDHTVVNVELVGRRLVDAACFFSTRDAEGPLCGGQVRLHGCERRGSSQLLSDTVAKRTPS